MQKVVSILFSLMLFVSCYNQGPQTSDAWDLTEQQLDSISFYTTHHYTQNFNFVVRADSLVLISQQPSEWLAHQSIDSIAVRKGDCLVVAEIMKMPADSIDSVWVRVARDQQTIGWVHEHDLLSGVSPDNSISQFIDFFSNTHLLIFLAFLVVVASVYGFRYYQRHQSKLVHFNDIDSFYPMSLCLVVSCSAVLYSSIQLFAPESWRHFYYHPTLNPFALPYHLGLFIASVWAIIIVGIAALDDSRRYLPLGEYVLYLLGLAGVCAVDYVVFSISTLYYIGYPLLVAYVIYAIRKARR